MVSTAGDATLSVADSDPGHLANGAFTLPSRCRWRVLEVHAGPRRHQRPVTITFTQLVKDNDPLRTGTYSKALTFTLSTTTP